MGGGIRIGNVTPTAEFNVWCDPEAASIVFTCGAPLRMCGLDVTHQVRVGQTEVDRIAAVGGARASFLADILMFFAHRYGERTGLSGGPMHDPLAVLAITHADRFGFVDRDVRVELYWPGAPTLLTVDDAAAPLAVEGAPQFGWVVNDPDRGEVQTAYELVVSSSRRSARGGRRRVGQRRGAIEPAVVRRRDA